MKKDVIRILVVDDDRSMAKTLVDIFRIKGYEAEAVHSAAEALAMIREQRFDCVLSDIKMPTLNGVELYRAIKAEHPTLPVVLMTAYSADNLVQEGLDEGVIAVLTKPLDISVLLDFFSHLRKERSIVVVDDDPIFCQTLGDLLRLGSYQVQAITNPEELMDHLDVEPIVILLDMKLRSVTGYEVLVRIRQAHPRLPVILVTGYRSEMSSAIEAALDVGAYACLYKPLQIEKLLQVLREVHHQELGRVLGQDPAKDG